MEKNLKKPDKLSVCYIIAAAAIECVAVFYYGIRALAVSAAAIAAALIIDFICVKLRGRKYSASDLTCIIEALLLSFMMPSSISFGIIAAASAVMVIIGRHILGENENRVMPAPAIGYVFALVMWKEDVLSFPEITGSFKFMSYSPEELTVSSSSWYNTAGVFKESWYDIFIGSTQGPLGTGVIALIIICAIMLIIARKIRIAPIIGILISTSFFGSVVCKSGSYLNSALYEICANMVIFAAVFLAADKDIAPSKFSFGILYGLVTGMTAYYLTFFTERENAIVPALIICSPICVLLKNLSSRSYLMRKSKKASGSAEKRVTEAEKKKEEWREGEACSNE